MRVTDGARYAEIFRNLTRIQTDHDAATREAMTGLRIDRPSKDPTGAAEIARLRASLSRNAAHKEAIHLVRGDAELAESALAEGTDLLIRAREIAASGANGVLNANDRTAMAKEVRGVRDEMVRIANTRGTKGYIFAGSKTNAPAIDAAGTFQGDDVLQSVDIGSGAPVQVGVSGSRAFTAAGGREVLADLDALAVALESNDQAGISASLDVLDAGQKQLINERSRAGLLVARLDTSTAVIEQLDLDSARRQEQVGAADPVEAYSRMNALGSALERSVAVSRQILEVTGVSRF
jgi:flagellar hook-associated protein 3 FlgL